MPLFNPRRPLASAPPQAAVEVPSQIPALILAVIAFGATGCAALNPLGGVSAGSAATWSPAASPRVAVAGRTSARPTRNARPAPLPAPDAEEPDEVVPPPGPTVRAEAPFLAGASAVAASLREFGAPWIGTPYHFGGETPRGIDCSAFTRALMREAFDLALPRNTTLQVQEGEPVGKDELRAGDLVFFRRGGTRHVGVYLGDGEFIHASSSRGVTISQLEEDYFRRYYWTARRVLAPSGPLLASTSARPRPRAERVEEALLRFGASEAAPADSARTAW